MKDFRHAILLVVPEGLDLAEFLNEAKTPPMSDAEPEKQAIAQNYLNLALLEANKALRVERDQLLEKVRDAKCDVEAVGESLQRDVDAVRAKLKKAKTLGAEALGQGIKEVDWKAVVRQIMLGLEY